MQINDKISDGKLQYINKEAAKISALPAEKIDKYEYFTGEEILSCKQRKIIEQTKLACSAFGESCRKTNRTVGWCFKVPGSF